MNYSLWKMKHTIAAAFICLLILISPAQAATWHVSEHVNGGDGSGFDWPNANPSLADALANPQVQPGDTIRVGQGVYHPDPGQSFTIDFALNQIILLGGHAGWLPDGTLAPDPFQRDVQANQTILSGDLMDPPDAPFIFDRDYLIDMSRTDNAFTVVTVQNVTRGTRIDGFFIERGNRGTFTGSNATGYRGGGMLIDDSAMDIVNCTFRFNAVGVPPDPEDPLENPGVTSDGGGASVRGGQLMISGEVDYTRFINCTFHDNFSARGGGLAVVDGSLEDSTVKMINCLYYNNQAIEMSTAVLKPDHGSGRLVRLPMEDQSQ